MSIAMYGGSFDPIHNGHIALCRAALEESRADRLLLVPTGESPHRDNTGKTPFVHRLALCQIAAREIPRAEASDLEQRLGGVNYTIRTVLALKRQYPDQPLFLIVGGDMLLCFHRWKGLPGHFGKRHPPGRSQNGGSAPGAGGILPKGAAGLSPDPLGGFFPH